VDSHHSNHKCKFWGLHFWVCHIVGCISHHIPMMPGIHSNCIYCIQKLHYPKPYPYDTYHIVSCIPSLTLHIPIFPIINGWEHAEAMTNLYPIPVVSQIVSYSWYNYITLILPQIYNT
jgi:hypothetical protein